jgi:hypothetical protein
MGGGCLPRPELAVLRRTTAICSKHIPFEHFFLFQVPSLYIAYTHLKRHHLQPLQISLAGKTFPSPSPKLEPPTPTPTF